MVEELNISYEPFREIVIMEYMKFNTPDDLARFLNIASGGKPTGVYWTSSVAFFYYPMSTSTETATKALIEEKKVYWAFVGYALMPDYRLIIETREKIMIPVIDMSSNSLFKKAAMWLKERKEEAR
jgi:hypothetical protein